MSYFYDKSKDPTLKELKDIFNEHNLEFFIKKEKGNVVKVHFMIKEEENNNENITDRS
jgi:hypothetical protein